MITSSFLQAAVAGLVLGMFACAAVAQPAAKLSLPSFFQLTAGPPTLPGPTPPPPTLLAKESQVESFQSSSQGNQSIVDPPLSVPHIPDAVPADVKLLL